VEDRCSCDSISVRLFKHKTGRVSKLHKRAEDIHEIEAYLSSKGVRLIAFMREPAEKKEFFQQQDVLTLIVILTYTLTNPVRKSGTCASS
jgi:hypothetical protein